MTLEWIRKRLAELYPQMIEWRRHLHMYPELSFQEEKTPQMIATLLNEFGLEVRENVGGRGVLGILKGGKKGKTIALRADFDALPIQDAKDVPYKSTVPGVMHACGHDAHTATLLSVAKVLAEHAEDVPGTIVFIHQFAEEIAPGGAKPMIEDGCLDGVDVIFGTHLWSGIPVGHVGVRDGFAMAAADKFIVDVLGVGGHGGLPHHTVDSIAIGSQLVNAMQQVVSRRIDPLESAVVTVGKFEAGEAYNVIADQAKLVGTTRAFSEDVRSQLETELEQVVRGICQAYGASCNWKYERGYPALENDTEPTRFVYDIASQLFGSKKVFDMDPVMGGEDFAYYLHHVPGTFFFTGSGNAKKQTDYPHHHPRFDVDEDAMLIAAQTLAAAALHYSNT